MSAIEFSGEESNSVLQTEPGPLRSSLVPSVHIDAWHGPAGRYVAEIAPSTESDPLAILVQVLAWSGCHLGRSVFCRVGNAVHYPSIWPLIVGATSTGRKGTSEYDSISALSAQSAQPRRLSGLSTGEGLIEAFMGADGSAPPDPRLLVVETEWEGVIAKSRREGNTLAAVLRDAWDGRPLSTMNVRARSRTVDVHSLTIVGHLTPGTLRAKMSSQDLFNGFLNRFFVFLVHRPQLVPWPEPMAESTKERLVHVVEAVGRATQGEYFLTVEAREVYQNWYVDYSQTADEMPERIAMATARLQANLIRSALIYSALDNTDCKVEAQHVKAAIALVDNSGQSCERLLAAGKVGLDAKVLDLLRAHGQLTKTGLRDKFNRHVKADDIARAIADLKDAGLIEETENNATGGRASTIYCAKAR